jgi:hypothetical protein
MNGRVTTAVVIAVSVAAGWAQEPPRGGEAQGAAPEQAPASSATAPGGTAAAGTPPADATVNVHSAAARQLYRGWIAEQVHRDLTTARTCYEHALDDTSDPRARTLAAARLLELDALDGRPDETGDAWRAVRELDLGGGRGRPMRPDGAPPPDRREPPTGGERDDRGRDGRRPVRPFVARVYDALDQRADTTLQQLQTARAEAVRAGRAAEAVRLGRQINGLRFPAQSRQRQRRQVWTVIVERHLEGRHDDAERLARILVTRPAEPPAADADPSEVVESARTAIARVLETPTLTSKERQVVERLRVRIEELTAAGDERGAAELVARLPYPFPLN